MPRQKKKINFISNLTLFNVEAFFKYPFTVGVVFISFQQLYNDDAIYDI